MKPSTRSERPQSLSAPLRLDRRQQLAHRLRRAARRQLRPPRSSGARRGALRGVRCSSAIGAHSRTPAAGRPGRRLCFAGCAPRTRCGGPSGGRWTARGFRASRAPRAGSPTSPAPSSPPRSSPATGSGSGPRSIKANPDSPQTHARRLALEEGKKLVMAVPRLRDQHPFRAPRPQAPHQGPGARGGDDQGGASARPGRRARGDPRDRLRALRLGRGQPERRPARQGRRLLRPRVRAADRGGQDRRSHPGGDHRPPDPDPARAPDGHRPRPAGRPDRHAARGDRGRAGLQAARAASSGTTSSPRRSTRSRSWSGWGTRKAGPATGSRFEPRTSGTVSRAVGTRHRQPADSGDVDGFVCCAACGYMHRTGARWRYGQPAGSCPNAMGRCTGRTGSTRGAQQPVRRGWTTSVPEPRSGLDPSPTSRSLADSARGPASPSISWAIPQKAIDPRGAARQPLGGRVERLGHVHDHRSLAVHRQLLHRQPRAFETVPEQPAAPDRASVSA